MTATADVAVIGGGIHGCSVALHCARRGLSVTVVEKNTVARHASGVNAGGVRRLGRAIPEIPLSSAAMQLWRQIHEMVGDDCGFHALPMLKLAENHSDMTELRARSDALQELGFKHEIMLDAHELFEILPHVSRHCVGALACFDDGFADPFRTTRAFRNMAEHLGARFHETTQVFDIGHEAGKWRLKTTAEDINAAAIVNCAGAWSGRITDMLGEPVPVEPIAPMMIVTSRLPPFCNAVVSATHRPLSFKQLPNGTVLIGGGRRGIADLSGEHTTIVFGELAKTARTACELFPVVSVSSAVRCWAGLEARMPDDLPVIGASSTAAGVFHAFGFSAHGFQLGPIVGRVISDLIIEGASELPIEPFRIERFAQPSAAASCTTISGTN